MIEVTGHWTSECARRKSMSLFNGKLHMRHSMHWMILLSWRSL